MSRPKRSIQDLFLFGLKKDKNLQKLKAEREKGEMESCTFSPVINKPSGKVKRNKSPQKKAD